MSDVPDTYALDYQPGKIVYGADAIASIGDELAERDLERALVVCGRTVGSTDAVMDPVRDGLGDRLAGVFDETTSEKYLSTALEGARHAQELDADVLVAVGGGSSLDTAKTIAALASYDRDPEAVAEDAVAAESLSVAASGDPLSIAAVPTTLAGADLSVVAGLKLTLDPDERPVGEVPSGGLSDGRLMPTLLCYDPELFRTTPAGVLRASAMNGFDKGVELLYSRHATPITDGTAVRGLRLLQSGLPALSEDPIPDDRLAEAVTGTVLVQYGLSTPDHYRASIIHAFGHGFSRGYAAHQGEVHGIVAPHVLRYVLENADVRLDLFAEAFDVSTAGRDRAVVVDDVVEAVASVRDGLGLPSQLRDIEGLARDDFPGIAEVILADAFMDAAPADLDPTADEIVGVLEDAW
ncbi:iron-containing alcohol dehydrogenase [Halobacterium sp. KA-4]|nr:iron-containing alcohol dehydrogenase family protein [Halobacterium sp. KA-4]MCD2201675.1 iron-containing alcohol dehydrogenase [Halobacterium sp. KA-4]